MTNSLKAIDNEFAWRFVKGCVSTIQPDLLHLVVDVPGHPEIKKARLEVDAQKTQYHHNQVIELFLTSPVHGHTELWRAAAGLMADPSQNPWQQPAFSEGDIIEGEVTRYVGNDAAIVTLTGNLTRNLDWTGCKQFFGYLHRNQTPDAPICPNIRNMLHVGDIIQAMIAGNDAQPAMDRKRLHITLDVDQLLSLRKQHANTDQLEFPVNEHKISKVAVAKASLPKRKLLIVDNDKAFCKSWQNLLVSWNVQVRYCQTTKEVVNELNNNDFDACLLDYDLGLNDADYALIEGQLQQAKNETGLIISKMSGDLNWAHSQQTPIFEKPLTPSIVLAWMDSGEIPSTEQTKRVFFQGQHSRWRASGGETCVIRRAEQLLKKCCKKNQQIRALGIKLERPGYYAIRIAHGISEQDIFKLEEHLQNTAIAGAIETHCEQELSISKSGSLKEFMTKWNCHMLWVCPYPVDKKYERALAFFSPDTLGEEHRDFVKTQKSHFEDIAYWLDDAQQLEASEVFATQGRLLASTLHEIRTAVSTVAGYNEILIKQLQNPIIKADEVTIHEGLNNIDSSVKRLLELSENGLDHIRPTQTHINDVAILLQNILHLIRGRMKAEGFQAALKPLLNRSYQPIVLPFPPKFLEIPLINLLDNAFHFCGKRYWAQVQVSLAINPDYPETPLEIKVADNGLGMTQAQVNKLFSARETGRDFAGSGMGLYLSKQLIESIGGTISLEKTVRWFGSGFCIRLPYVG